MKQETTLCTIYRKDLDGKNKKKIIPDKILSGKVLSKMPKNLFYIGN